MGLGRDCPRASFQDRQDSGSRPGRTRAEAGSPRARPWCRIARMSQHDVFVSYASQDKQVADAIVARLENRGVRCWYAPRDITGGASYAAAIVEAIRNARVFILVLSTSSNESSQVTNEVERAVHHELHILPFRIDSIQPSGDLEYFVSRRHWLDALPPPAKAHIERLATTVAQLLKSTGPAASAAPEPPQREVAEAPTREGGRKRALRPLVAAAVVLLIALGWVFRDGLNVTDEPVAVTDEVAQIDEDSSDPQDTSDPVEDAEERSGAEALESPPTGADNTRVPNPRTPDPRLPDVEPMSDSEVDLGGDDSPPRDATATPPEEDPGVSESGEKEPETAEAKPPSALPPPGPAEGEPSTSVAEIALDLAPGEAGELPSGWTGSDAVGIHRDEGGLAYLHAPGPAFGSAESPRATVSGDFLARLELVSNPRGRVTWTLEGTGGSRDLLVDLLCHGPSYGNAWNVKAPRVDTTHNSAGPTAPTLFQVERRGEVFRFHGDGVLLATMRDDGYGDFERVRIDYLDGSLGVVRCTLEETRAAEEPPRLVAGRVNTEAVEPGGIPAGWTVDGTVRRSSQGSAGLAAASRSRHRLTSPALGLAEEFFLELSIENDQRTEAVLTLLGSVGERDLPLHFLGHGASYSHAWKIGLPGAVQRDVQGSGASRIRVTRQRDAFQLHFDDQLVEAIPLRGLGPFRGFQLDFLDEHLKLTGVDWGPPRGEAGPAVEVERAGPGAFDGAGTDAAVYLRLDPAGIGDLPAGWKADAGVALAPIEGMIGLHARESSTVSSPEFELRGDSEVVFDLRHRQATSFRMVLEGDAGLPLAALDLKNPGPGYLSRWSGSLGATAFGPVGLQASLVHTFQLVRRDGRIRLFVDGVPVAATLDSSSAPLRRLRMQFGDGECWLVRLGVNPLVPEPASPVNAYEMQAKSAAPGELPEGWTSQGLHARSPSVDSLVAARPDLQRLHGPPVRVGESSVLEFSVRNTHAAGVRLTLLGAGTTPDLVVRLENASGSYNFVWSVDLPGCSRSATGPRTRETSQIRVELDGHLVRLTIDGEPVQAAVVPDLGEYRGWILDTTGRDLGLTSFEVGPLDSGSHPRSRGSRPGPFAELAEGDSRADWATPGSVAVTRSGGIAALRSATASPASLKRELDLSGDGDWCRVGFLQSRGTSLVARLLTSQTEEVSLKLTGGAAGYSHNWTGTFGDTEAKFRGGDGYAPVLLQITRSGSDLVLHAEGAEVARTPVGQATIGRLEMELPGAELGVLEFSTRSDTTASTGAETGLRFDTADLSWGALPEGWRAGDGVSKGPAGGGLRAVRPGWHRLESPPVALRGDFAAQLRVRYTSSSFVVTCLTNEGVPVPVQFSNAGPGYRYPWRLRLAGGEPVDTTPGRSTSTSTVGLIRRGDVLEVWIDAEKVASCSARDLGTLAGLRFDFGDEVTELLEARLSPLESDK